jgi:hypothetical protein
MEVGIYNVLALCVKRGMDVLGRTISKFFSIKNPLKKG